MNKSKLILVLNTLGKEESRTFKRFLNSKIFNQHVKVISLFDYIHDQLKLKKPELSKEAVFEKLFPGKKFRDKTIRDLMSYLFQYLEQFLAFQEMHNENANELLALCKSYRKRNLLKLFTTTAQKVDMAQKQSEKRDIEYHHRNYQVQQEQYYAIIQKGRATATNLQEVSDRLDISYFANRLRQSCIMLAHQSVYNTDYEPGMVEEVIKEVERLDLLHIPAIGVYYYSYKAQTNEDNIEYFKSLQASLIANVSLFDISEMRDIYLLAINIGIKNLNYGKFELMNELLELYKSGVNQRILLTNEVLSRFTYKNITALAIRMKQFGWVEQFIEEFAPNLESKTREPTYRYNLAKLHYSKKEYLTALQLLILNASSDDVYINLDTKILLSRIYFETNDLDALEALINSFKIFIRRKTIISYHRLSYKNFITSLTKLTILNPFDKAARKQLLGELTVLQPLPDKYWFIKQLS